MKKLLLALAIFPLILFATEDIDKISEAMGFIIGKNLSEMGLKLDPDSLIKGIVEATANKDSVKEEECLAIISKMQDKALNEEAQKNLERANQFLIENSKNKDIKEITPGKLQYRIEKEGTGASVESFNSPLIRYKGKYQDGTIFGSSLEPEVVYLDEAIEGFSKGIIGMKEGEKRILFIHPDLGYKTSGILAPNSLLTFEIEVIKAEGPVTSQNMSSPKKIKEALSIPEENFKR